MKTLNEMRERSVLTDAQYSEIREWVAQARTPEATMQMPDPLWRALTLASAPMNIDADLVHEPAFDDVRASSVPRKL